MNFSLEEIVEIQEVSYEGPVYDLQVEGDHSYCVNSGYAVHNCSDAAHGMGAGIILDGGMRSSGDVCKAFCANSDMVMIGGMFAGTDECEGDIITRKFRTNLVGEDSEGNFVDIIEEKKYKLFYGMSSDYSQEQHLGGKKEYRTSEGRVEEVEYKGPVQTVVDDILGGLRSCGTYIGAAAIKDFGKCATLIKVNRIHDRF